MLERLGGAIARHRRAILAVSALALIGSALAGLGIHSKLIRGGLEDPDSENVVGDQVLQERFPLGAANLVLLVTPKDRTVDDAEIARAGADLTQRLEDEPAVTGAESYWTIGYTALRAIDGSSALVVARVQSDPNTIVDQTEPLVEEYTFETDEYRVAVGGSSPVIEAAARNTQRDYVRAELIAIPIVVILLLFVYRSVAAALLPAVVGGLAVVGAYPVLRFFAAWTDVTVFSLNIVTALGLALGIDYSLFTVSRFREEVGRGASTTEAVRRTVAQAGRTIGFSAFAVAASLAALFVFPGPLLRSFAVAGIAVVGLAAIGAIVVLPAVLAVLGPRVEWGTVPFLRRRTDRRRWYRIAMSVMRRPLLVTVAVVAFLLLVGAPFLRIQLGMLDARSLPEEEGAARVSQVLGEDYVSREGDAISIAVLGVDPSSERDREAIIDFQQAVSATPGVARIDGALTGDDAVPLGFLIDGELVEVEEYDEFVNFDVPGLTGMEQDELVARFEDIFFAQDATWFRVVLEEPPSTQSSGDAVEEIRGLDPPFDVLVTGQAAQYVDARSAHLDRLPLALTLIAVVTFVVLFAMFGSVLVPVKAILLNVLSLTATFGALVWIFQDGHLSNFLDFQASGDLYVAVPILLFCVAFGTSMDYEVFMLSRIKEEYDRTDDNEQSIAIGIERSARIVTAAAATFAVVMFSIGTSQVSFIKLLGVGLGIAILVDAFVIRVALLPATMRLAGAANWWAPRWVGRARDRLGLQNRGAVPAAVDQVERPPATRVR